MTNIHRLIVIHSDAQQAGAPHAVTLRTPDARLIYYAGMVSRSKTSIADLGVLDDWHGYLVRDDYAGWHQFDPHLAGVQQCAAHLIRHCKGVLELHPDWQKWAAQVVTVLRTTAKAVEEARAAEVDELAPEVVADLRERYDKAVDWGITTNRHRDWPKGNHPGYTLAQRLKDKAEQVWLFAKNFKSPGRTIPRSRHSRVRNDTRPSRGTGTPPTPSATTCASAPT